MNIKTKPYDIFIVGTGITGCAAALFAADRGLSCAIAGETGEIIYSSGLIDLMGVYPIHQRKTWKNPWEAIHALRKDKTGHPYDTIGDATMKKALDSFTNHLKRGGLAYTSRHSENSKILPFLSNNINLLLVVPRSMAPTYFVIIFFLRSFYV